MKKKDEAEVWCKEHYAQLAAEGDVNSIAATVELGNAFLDIMRKEGADTEDAARMNAELIKRSPICCKISKKEFQALMKRAKIGAAPEFH